jgi:hypothetical protein
MALDQILLIPGIGGVPPGPINTVAPLVTGTPDVDEELSCTEGTWTGTGTITYAYQWLRGSSVIAGATSATYTVTLADRGAFLSCRVTATDDLGSRSKRSNAVGPVPLSGALLLETGDTLLLETGFRLRLEVE